MRRETKRRIHSVLDAINTGGFSLSEEIKPEEPEISDAEAKELPALYPDYERFLPETVGSLEEQIERNPNFLRESFHYMLITMSEAYDSLDHQHSPDRLRTTLQYDTFAVRELVKKLASSDSPF